MPTGEQSRESGKKVAQKISIMMPRLITAVKGYDMHLFLIRKAIKTQALLCAVPIFKTKPPSISFSEFSGDLLSLFVIVKLAVLFFSRCNFFLFLP